MTTSSSPETIHGDLLQEVAAYYVERDPDEFSLRLLRDRAERLSKVDLPAGLEIRGHIALLAGDLSAGSQLLDRAMQLNGRKVEPFIRYLQGLENSGNSSSVFAVFSRFRDLLPGNVAATRTVCQLLAGQGYLFVADQLKADLEKMNASSGELLYTPGEQMLAQFERGESCDAEFSEAVCYVRDFLHEKKVKIKRVRVAAITGEGDANAALMYEFDIKSTAEQAQDIEWELYGALDSRNFPVEANRRLLFVITADSTDV